MKKDDKSKDQTSLFNFVDCLGFVKPKGGSCSPDDYEESDYEKKVRGVL